MTVVVTGASGHVGANLVRMLLDRGEQVRAVSRGDADVPPALAGLDVEYVRGDVRELDAMKAAFRGADLVYHLAAKISIVGDPDGSVRAINVDGTQTVAQAALEAGIRRVVHCCSVHAFDLRHPSAIDENTPRVAPDDRRHPAYDRSKAEGEARMREYVKRGLDAVIVHPSGVIGPHDYAPSRMGTVFLQLHRRTLPSMVDGGFDFVDVRDVSRGILAAAERGRTNESYILAGRYLPIRELGQIVQRITGVRPPRMTSPIWLAKVGVPFVGVVARITRAEPIYTFESLAALESNSRFDTSKAQRELGYVVTPTEETVRDLYECFARRGVLPSEVAQAVQRSRAQDLESQPSVSEVTP